MTDIMRELRKKREEEEKEQEIRSMLSIYESYLRQFSSSTIRDIRMSKSFDKPTR